MTGHSFLAAGSQRRSFSALLAKLLPQQVAKRMAGRVFEHFQGEPLAKIRFV